MPAKKKKGGKKKGAVAPTGPEPDSPEGLRLALVKQAKELEKSCKMEAHDFNKFQQQRDQINYFWIVEKKTLDDRKTERRNKERELQDLEEKHQVEIKTYKQSVKHLLYEHQDETTKEMTDVEVQLKLLEDSHRDEEGRLKHDTRALNVKLKELELEHQHFVTQLKSTHDINISNLRAEFERKAREMQLKFEKINKEVRVRLDTKRKQELMRIENRKNRHITRLMKEHEDAFTQIKNYYNDITHNNLELIKSLKEDVKEMKKRERIDEKKMLQIAAENKRMSEPLKLALADVERLRKEEEEYVEDKHALSLTKANLLMVEETLKKLMWEYEVLEQRFERLQADRDRIFADFQRSIYDVKQKCGFKNLLIRKKMARVEDSIEKKDAHLNEVITQANLEGSKIATGIDDIIQTKNKYVRSLQEELEQLLHAHNESVRAYEQAMVDFGVPAEELGFLPKLLSASGDQ
jgi:hypothetical protein